MVSLSDSQDSRCPAYVGYSIFGLPGLICDANQIRRLGSIGYIAPANPDPDVTNRWPMQSASTNEQAAGEHQA
jgi:hypothetical protein